MVIKNGIISNLKYHYNHKTKPKYQWQYSYLIMDIQRRKDALDLLCLFLPYNNLIGLFPL